MFFDPLVSVDKKQFLILYIRALVCSEQCNRRGGAMYAALFEFFFINFEGV
jgi:hypothetical protein